MNKFKRLLPGHDFKDDISQAPKYSTPCTDLMGFDEPFGQVPDILDPTKTFQLGLGVRDLSGEWTEAERALARPRQLITPGISRVPTQYRAQKAQPKSLYRLNYQATYNPPTPEPEYPPYTYDASDFQVDTMPETEFQLSFKPKWTDRMRNKLRKSKKKDIYFVDEPSTPKLTEIPTLDRSVSSESLESAASSALLIRTLARKTVVMRPVDSLIDIYPQFIGPILLVETAMIGFAMYEVYILLDGVFKTIKALCLPLILLAKLVGV